LLIEWPAHDDDPSTYFRPSLPEKISIEALVSVADHRWRIERDHQDQKQDFGLAHHEGRGWRGFHLHAVPSIATYGFPMAECLTADKPVGGKNFIERKVPSFLRITSPAASCARSATWRP
jgi:SRSO17 transposase